MAIWKIGDGGTADYATFTTAEAALSLPEGGGTIYQVTGLVNEGFTFLAANYTGGLEITALSGEEIDGSGTGAAIASDVEVQVPAGAVSNVGLRRRIIITAALSTEVTYDNCYINNSASAAIDIIVFVPTSNATLTNCIILNGDDDNMYSSGDAANLNYVGCTSLDAGRMGFIRANTTDCFAIGNGTSDFFGTIPGGDYNASGDTTASQFANNLQNRTTADFENYAGGDYSIASGSALITAGTGGGRIGAILPLPAEGSSSIPVISHHLRMNND